MHTGPIHTKLDGLTFSLYSADEIRKLSVVKVITPLGFNALGHPLPGGLYDPAMGKFYLQQVSNEICPGTKTRKDLRLIYDFLFCLFLHI